MFIYVRVLHEANILDDHLKLKGTKQLKQLDVATSNPDGPQPGSEKRRAYYPIELSSQFSTVAINLDECFLYRYL